MVRRTAGRPPFLRRPTTAMALRCIGANAVDLILKPLPLSLRLLFLCLAVIAPHRRRCFCGRLIAQYLVEALRGARHRLSDEEARKPRGGGARAVKGAAAARDGEAASVWGDGSRGGRRRLLIALRPLTSPKGAEAT